LDRAYFFCAADFVVVVVVAFAGADAVDMAGAGLAEAVDMPGLAAAVHLMNLPAASRHGPFLAAAVVGQAVNLPEASRQDAAEAWLAAALSRMAAARKREVRAMEVPFA
jgi:hypothetical protein